VQCDSKVAAQLRDFTPVGSFISNPEVPNTYFEPSEDHCWLLDIERKVVAVTYKTADLRVPIHLFECDQYVCGSTHK